jgi:hypothetical protein
MLRLRADLIAAFDRSMHSGLSPQACCDVAIGHALGVMLQLHGPQSIAQVLPVLFDNMATIVAVASMPEVQGSA